MMSDRIRLGRHLLADHGVLVATIDDYQQKELHYLLEYLFGTENWLGTVSVRINPSGRPSSARLRSVARVRNIREEIRRSGDWPVDEAEKQNARYHHEDEDGNYMWELFRKRGSNSERTARPSLYYPIYVEGDTVRVPEMEYLEASREWKIKEPPKKGEIVVTRLTREVQNAHGVGRRKACDPSRKVTRQKRKKGKRQFTISFARFRWVLPLTTWIDAKYSATEHGTGILKHFFTEYNIIFVSRKSLYAVEDCLRISGLSEPNGTAIDYFAGSGTTGHAVIPESGRRRDSESTFWSRLASISTPFSKPRILKAVYSSEWKDGKPVGRDGD